MTADFRRIIDIVEGKVGQGLPATKPAFSTALRHVANRILRSENVAAHGYGFQDGGCLSFADGIRKWSDGFFTLAATYRLPAPSAQAEHVFAWRGADCLDSDGVSTRSGMIDKMRRFYRLDCYVAPYDPAGEQHIPFVEPLRDHVADALRLRFGPFDPDHWYA